MKLQAVDTTDDKWLGLQFDLDDPLEKDFFLPIGSNIFRIDKAEALGKGFYRYSNPHYIVIAREIVDV